MFKRILMPLDLTERHQQAIAAAAELARSSGGAVTLLHVVEEIHGVAHDEEHDFFERLQQTAQDQLERARRMLTERGIACTNLIRYGNRVQEIARCAAELASDLIIVSAPNIDPEHPAASWGSLSWRIGVIAPCPVLMVK